MRHWPESSATAPCSGSASGCCSGARAPARRGLTLLELLAVVAALAVLIALLLPALGGARERADELGYVSTGRQLAASLFMYCEDYDRVFPYFGTPGDPYEPLTYFGFRFEHRFSYFTGHRMHWASLVVPDYYDVAHDERVDVYRQPYPLTPGAPERLFRTHYLLTDTAFADPRYWIGPEPREDLSLIRPTRLTQIASPSLKGLMVQAETIDGTDDAGPFRAVVVMGDGSASLRGDYWAGNDEHSGVVSRPFGALPWHVFSTENGLAGRDW